MIITAYFDESGTHAGSSVTTMGGVMANALQWARFGYEFRRLKKRHGFNIFHTKKFKSGSGDFSKWTVEQKRNLLTDLGELTGSAFMEGVVMHLDNAEYEKDFRGTEPNRRLRLDSKYGFCFRECLLHCLREAKRREGKDRTPELHIVLESGHENAGDASRIFDEVRHDLRVAKYDALKTLAFAGKDECDPLMIADSLAHTVYVRETRKLQGLESRIERIAAPVGTPGITYLHYQPGSLAAVRRDLIHRYTRQRT